MSFELDHLGYEKAKEIISQAEKILYQLNHMSGEKRKLIQSGKMDELNRLDGEEQKLLSRLEKRNQRLIELFMEFGESYLYKPVNLYEKKQIIENGYNLLNEASGLHLQKYYQEYLRNMAALEKAETLNQLMLIDRVDIYRQSWSENDEEIGFYNPRNNHQKNNKSLKRIKQKSILVNQVI